MEDFCSVLDDLSLVDIKPDKGWFTWSNNREEPGLVRERLDRFVASVGSLEKMPCQLKWSGKAAQITMLLFSIPWATSPKMT
ncbi:hypothetical protein J1N35_037588 [Gossypium stocksii]|uniref:Uncharacterized protein n=1 Tax=Gossypium stocksii TaxID=47602 RepID=A0A9D3ZLU4_9ROSI|nr:hypothetical protein J1N35_037588 [Gossypium stocksii]